MAIDSVNDIASCYDTEDEAKLDVERAKMEDAIYKYAKILFHAAIASVLSNFDVGRSERGIGLRRQQKAGDGRSRGAILNIFRFDFVRLLEDGASPTEESFYDSLVLALQELR